MDDNPYRSPQSVSTPAEVWAVPEGGPSEAEYRAAIGSKPDYYLGKWWHLMRGADSGAGFNWVALLFAGFWLPYRKMYKWALGLYGLTFLMTGIELAAEAAGLAASRLEMIDRLIGLVVNIIIGTQANRWYFSHVSRIIQSTKAEGHSTEETLVLLGQRGGTSVLAGIGFLLLFLVLMFGLGVASELLFAGSDAVAR